jgi:hypothetical protein
LWDNRAVNFTENSAHYPRRTSHSEEACDRYIKGFKKVLKLHGDGVPAENIASELEMSKSLVRQYVEIIVDQADAREG